MELKAHQLKGWTQSSPPEQMASASACLVFGPDAGGVTDLCLALAKDQDRVTLEGNEITAPAIASHTDTLSLFGGGTTVLIRGAVDKHVKEIEPILEAGINPGSKIIIQAGNLKGTSKLKKLFAASKTAVSVALYPMKGNEIPAFAKAYAQANGCNLDRDALSVISQELSGDRARSARMMETICLHALGSDRTVIKREDVIAVCRGIDESDLSSPLDHALSGNTAAAISSLDDKIHRGENPIALLRIFSYRAFRMLAIAQLGKPAKDAVKQAKPPVFWAEQDMFVRILGRHDAIAFEKIIAHIDRAEDQIVETAAPAQVVLPDLLLKISKGSLKWPKF